MPQEYFTAVWIQIAVMVFIRISAMIALLPVFGSQSVPVRLKAGLVILLTILMVPLVDVEGVVAAENLGMFVVLLLKELFVGLVIGFAASMLFSAVQFAGRLVDLQMGFAFVQVVDPFTDTTVTSMGQFKTLLFTIFFLLINGHYFMLLAIQKSFEFAPLAQVVVPGGKLAFTMTQMVGKIFVSGLQLAAPVFGVLVLSSVSLGVIARTVPQMNVFFVGMPMKIMLGFGLTILVLPVLAMLFKKMTDLLLQDIWNLLYLIA